MATRRRGDLDGLVSAIDSSGGPAIGIHADARDEQAVVDLVDRIEGDLGPMVVAVFNVGGNVRFGLAETTARVYRKAWE